MSKILQADKIGKCYRSVGEVVYAVNDFSLTVEQNDYLAIVGPSGAGKSTLLHILGGLDAPSEGKVIYNGQDVYGMKDNQLSYWRNKTVGFVFQFYHLIEELNVLENTAVACFNNRKSALSQAKDLLEYLGIGQRAKFFPSQLSGGEKQKAALARAIINDPQIILCDEPTGNLDKDSQDKVVQLLEKLNKEKNKTIILVTHNLELAGRAKKMITLKAGQMQQEIRRG
jgi:ABC-type lipoprotein export system ATPase subunit